MRRLTSVMKTDGRIAVGTKQIYLKTGKDVTW